MAEAKLNEKMSKLLFCIKITLLEQMFKMNLFRFLISLKAENILYF